MAVELPGSLTTLDASLWRRERPILSGEATADRRFGMRGLVAEQNHAWAYRRRVIAAMWNESGFIVDGSSTGQQPATLEIPWQWGRGITRCELSIWAEHCTVAVQVLAGSVAASAGVAVGTPAAESIQVVTLPSTAGVYGWAQVLYERAGGQTAKIYGFELAELELLSGEIT